MTPPPKHPNAQTWYNVRHAPVDVPPFVAPCYDGLEAFARQGLRRFHFVDEAMPC